MATLTVYPDPHIEVNTVDGYVQRHGVNEAWATIITGAGTVSNDTESSASIVIYSTATINQWSKLVRLIFLFDTSPLGATATISAAVLSLSGDNKEDGLSITPDLDIYTSTPASNTALATADYSQVQAVSQTGAPITYTNFSATGYNDFTFNATGRGNVSKTGISKFGARNANYDASGTPPAWASSNYSALSVHSAETANTTQDPKLVVTYTAAWLTGFSYRKSVPLSRPSGAVTDYQMKLLIGESAGIVSSWTRYCGLGASVSENPYDDEAWATPTNIYADDAAYATCIAATFDTNDYSQILKATTLGFNIPPGATILGVKVEVEKYHANGNVRDAVVQLTKNGAARVGDNKADTGTDFPDAATISTYGSATDLWGTTWTPAEINASTFGVHFVAKATGVDADAYVDYIRVTIYYSSEVDCGGKIQSGFHDLAFTTPDGTTPLDYWIDSITGISPNQLATVWIEFDSIGTGATTFYMYYGNTLPNPVDAPTTCQWKRYASNPILAVGAAGKWDDWWVNIHSIWKEESTYYAYYTGSKNDAIYSIGLATSADGITWTKDTGADGKVFSPGAGGKWDDYAVHAPLVWKEDVTWYMLYAGEGAAGGAWAIGLATSSDGINWTRYDVDNPVMTGTATTWDALFVVPGTMMLKEDSTYYFYYWGGTSASLANTWQIGVATSTDLHTWTKSENNPILVKGANNAYDSDVLEPCVFKIGSTYYMWYQADSNATDFSYICLASSSAKDSGWSKISGNPVAVRGGGSAWDANWTESPVVIQVGNSWILYYSGSGGSAATPRMQSGFMTYGGGGIAADTFGAGKSDDFEWGINADSIGNNPGNIPWTVTYGWVQIATAQHYGGTRSLSFVDNASTTNDCEFPLTAGTNYSMLFRVLWTGTPAGAINLILHGNGTNYIQVYMDTSGNIQYYDTDYHTVATISKDAWHLIEVNKINWTAGTYNIYVDDTLVKSGAVMRVLGDQNGVWRMQQGSNAGTCVYIDNIIIRNYANPEPAWGSWGEEEAETIALSLLLSDFLGGDCGRMGGMR